jgi:uncharacterized Zn-binding protein involved in type VI secretion
MSLIATAGDTITTNHGCDVTTTCLDGDPRVTVMGQPVHYVGGKATPHSVNVGDKCPIHNPTLAPNSSKVFVYPAGAPTQVARMGDNYSPVCTGVITGTKNVTVFAY